MSAWRTDIENAPEDAPHLRGLWVRHSNDEYESMYWEANSGFINDNGEFVGFNGDDFGWRAEDYTHWTDIPVPPLFHPEELEDA